MIVFRNTNDRLDGRGYFLNPTHVFAKKEHWMELREAKGPGSTTMDKIRNTAGALTEEIGVQNSQSMPKLQLSLGLAGQCETRTRIRSSYRSETEVERSLLPHVIRVEN